MRNQDIVPLISRMTTEEVNATVERWQAERKSFAAQLALPKERKKRKSSPGKVIDILKGLSKAERDAFIKLLEE